MISSTMLVSVICGVTNKRSLVVTLADSAVFDDCYESHAYGDASSSREESLSLI